jgi:tRNA(fMet)-specific endonuclease VapC
VTRLLIDTSAYSAFLQGHGAVGAEIAHADTMFFNPTVVGELLAGFRKGSRYRENLDLLRQFLDSPRVQSLVLDDETSVRYAILHDHLRARGTPIPSNDLWIAASAMQHGLRLLTLDRHFERLPQILISLY